MNRAKKLLGLIEGVFKSKEDAIAQAQANAKLFNVPFYVNDTTVGIYVERDPIDKDSYAGGKAY